VTEPRDLQPGEVHLATLALPMSFDLVADIMRALDRVAKKHGMVGVLLCDGTNRLIGRPLPAGSPASSGADH